MSSNELIHEVSSSVALQPFFVQWLWGGSIAGTHSRIKTSCVVGEFVNDNWDWTIRARPIGFKSWDKVDSFLVLDPHVCVTQSAWLPSQSSGEIWCLKFQSRYPVCRVYVLFSSWKENINIFVIFPSSAGLEASICLCIHVCVCWERKEKERENEYTSISFAFWYLQM